MQRLKMDSPEYISKSSARSLWQEYRVYPDRLELKFWVFLTTLKIPAEKIVDVKVVSPVLKNISTVQAPLYSEMGFNALKPEQVVNGIRFTPMELSLI